MISSKISNIVSIALDIDHLGKLVLLRNIGRSKGVFFVAKRQFSIYWQEYIKEVK